MENKLYLQILFDYAEMAALHCCAVVLLSYLHTAIGGYVGLFLDFSESSLVCAHTLAFVRVRWFVTFVSGSDMACVW